MGEISSNSPISLLQTIIITVYYRRLLNIVDIFGNIAMGLNIGNSFNINL